ncbi:MULTISPECIES: (2Fe-2S) ferredoxin domain-containing protein [unclassified Microcoleus]|jgi:(2Fe-2S) ferredoxin|uniref:(2Fe-2S) ferredoxin domain-containing protein n=1 Tax=unclassified Microcoleus TaxID=2642155 RepID=UPI001D224D36|nr:MULTISPECIES: (2Fe-2S) ferredoxin domain-containing protein [unclassified Microcoleus]MCC3444163.1 (2Fe-2S) ferredoxin domain-containing protein [Microcoleus sp. PH2017_03_ELD_O_A]MCC3468779.1 (2Fe-2S) ferredoxin domain-containing protein [Microcoleus sp. PH2017_06_SFM_O_A]MCC3503478.1 (2Fe-2S) ferredoxin domain-containing protein [Microcoleus sp. PH2017_19_SFW_U_A]TAE14640.1 MAG: (2Fe-2S) ferredoxin domain-containing protein [Oscillatoriales cyanobacterium]MCC3412085.1 (2Fe-2S) ferredoxin 
MKIIESSRRVLVCQNRTCRKQNAAKVLTTFQQLSGAEVEVVASSCLGQCGNGPMVLVLPEEVWYSGVSAEEVAAITDRHLRGGKPIEAMLYRKFHRHSVGAVPPNPPADV